jgi:hypothetical protein
MQTMNASGAIRAQGSHIASLVRALVGPLLWWTLAAGGATASGYPGAVLMTPLIWGMAVPVGYLYTLYALGDGLRPRLRFSALAGLALGLALAAILAIVIFLFLPSAPHEAAAISSIVLGVSGVGLLVCPLFSVLTTMLCRHRPARSGS